MLLTWEFRRASLCSPQKASPRNRDKFVLVLKGGMPHKEFVGIKPISSFPKMGSRNDTIQWKGPFAPSGKPSGSWQSRNLVNRLEMGQSYPASNEQQYYMMAKRIGESKYCMGDYMEQQIRDIYNGPTRMNEESWGPRFFHDSFPLKDATNQREHALISLLRERHRLSHEQVMMQSQGIQKNSLPQTGYKEDLGLIWQKQKKPSPDVSNSGRGFDEQFTGSKCDPLSFVNLVHDRCGTGDETTYHLFLQVLGTWNEETEEINVVLEKVACLFLDYPDLLTKFSGFLTDEQAKELMIFNGILRNKQVETSKVKKLVP